MMVQHQISIASKSRVCRVEGGGHTDQDCWAYPMRRSAHAGKMLGQRRKHHAITGSRSDGVRGAPVAETGFSHRLTAYKIVGHFFGLSYLYISRHNEVENCFF